MYIFQEATSKFANIIGLCSRNAAEALKVEHEDGHRAKHAGKTTGIHQKLGGLKYTAGAHSKWAGLAKHRKTK